MQNEIEGIVSGLKDQLLYHKELGVKQVPRTKKVIAQPSLKRESLKMIKEDMGDCTRCKLSKTRTHIVFGEGAAKADLMFVGEGPGRDEDLSGRPFVGRAGKLLTKIIEAMKYERKDVFIANIVKCRPPNNRPPEPIEVSTCEGFLHRQIATIKPKVIVCLGATAAQNLLKTEEKISSLRGKFIDWRGIKVIPTYHPAYLLRNPAMKKPLWEDMKKVMKYFKENH